MSYFCQAGPQSLPAPPNKEKPGPAPLETLPPNYTALLGGGIPQPLEPGNIDCLALGRAASVTADPGAREAGKRHWRRKQQARKSQSGV
jgi:hypothetical protein